MPTLPLLTSLAPTVTEFPLEGWRDLEIAAPLRILRLVLYLWVTTYTFVPFHPGDTT